MEGSNTDDEFELHRAVFDNDLRKLNQIIKHKDGVIDRKVSDTDCIFILSTSGMTSSSSANFNRIPG